MFHFAWLNPFDTLLYHAINGLAGHYAWMDSIMIFLANQALPLYAIFFVVAWFVLAKDDRSHRHGLLLAGLSGILALLINALIAQIWFRPRPFVAFSKGTFTQLVPHSMDASFPSDHASGSFGFATASWGRLPRWISIPFTVLAVLVLFARVYVGVHYPTDVLAGFFVGFLASRIVNKLSPFLIPVTTFLMKWVPVGRHTTNTSMVES